MYSKHDNNVPVNRKHFIECLFRYTLILLITGSCVYVYYCYISFQSTKVTSDKIAFYDRKINSRLKYILMWTHKYTEPFNYFHPTGRDDFMTIGCEYSECFLTDDKGYLSSLEEYDAVLFHAPEYTFIPNRNYWKHRVLMRKNPKQSFIFVCLESSANYPICEDEWDGYFNQTMTYQTTSDIYWGYVTIRDKLTGEIIGPKSDIKWIENMKSVDENFKNSLKSKTKAVAWFVSNCQSLSNRERYTADLQKELSEIGLFLDVYGKCGDKKCPPENARVCNDYLKNDYYFYLSFENSFSSDYTTEKLLTALKNSLVPIVWSGSNHSRFLPPGSYIDARTYSPKNLAAEIKRLMTNDIEEYASFFKWRNHYTYHSTLDSSDSHPLCALCKYLNILHVHNETRVKEDLRRWWNGPDQETRC